MVQKTTPNIPERSGWEDLRFLAGHLSFSAKCIVAGTIAGIAGAALYYPANAHIDSSYEECRAAVEFSTQLNPENCMAQVDIKDAFASTIGINGLIFGTLGVGVGIVRLRNGNDDFFKKPTQRQM